MIILFKYLFIFSILLNNIFCELLKPINGSELQYIHILFEWEETLNAESYEIQVSESNNFNNLIYQTITSNLYYILKNVIEWETTYYWRVRPCFLNGSNGEWINNFSFSTLSSLSPETLNTIIYNDSEYANGLTIFGSLDGSFSAAIDKDGKEIWNSGNDDIIFYNTDKLNRFFGCQYTPESENYLKGIQFSTTEGVIWEEPNTDFIHHEIIQLPNGNYLGIAQIIEPGPIPIGSWSSFYMASGYIADGITLEFPWQGDKIIEWDGNTGEIVWEWNTFEHLSMLDYEPTIWESMQPLQDGFFQWTHMNALAYDESDNTLLVSSRHLSRIIKINYSNNNIIWSMGHQMPSGNVTFGHDLGFSFQHSLEILDNGNIVFLDNGNLSPIFLGTDFPLSRALEVNIQESNGIYTSSIEWEYILDQNLFGFASGNVQKLENNNYLITTIGDQGTTLEVNQNHEIVWRANYDNGLVYRAKRINSIHSIDDNLSSSSQKNLEHFIIHPPKPNPFNPIINFEVYINFYQNININIYNINGQHVESIINSSIDVGSYYFHWNASDFPSGIYFINIESQNQSVSKKILLQK